MGVFVNTTFAEVVNVDLEFHAGEAGAEWTIHPVYPVSGLQVASSTDNVAVQTDGFTGTTAYYASGIPAGANYDVEATFEFTGATFTGLLPGITGRMSTTANTFYMARMSPDGTSRWQLYKAVDGVFTLLGTYNQVFTTGVQYSLRLEITDDTKKVFVDGVERISSTDNEITAAGRAGMRWVISTANQTGLRIDNFTATDIGGGVIDINANAANIALTGNQAAVEIGAGAPISITANAGQIALSGNQATVSLGAGAPIDVNATTGTLTLTGHQASVSIGAGSPIDITAATAALALVGNQAAISLGAGAPIEISAATAALSLIGNQAAVEVGAGAPINISAAFAQLAMTGHQATVELTAGAPIEINASTGAIALTGYQAQLSLAMNIAANVGNITLQGNRASVGLDVVTTPDFVGDCYLIGSTPLAVLTTATPRTSIATATPRTSIH